MALTWIIYFFLKVFIIFSYEKFIQSLFKKINALLYHQIEPSYYNYHFVSFLQPFRQILNQNWYGSEREIFSKLDRKTIPLHIPSRL